MKLRKLSRKAKAFLAATTLAVTGASGLLAASSADAQSNAEFHFAFAGYLLDKDDLSGDENCGITYNPDPVPAAPGTTITGSESFNCDGEAVINLNYSAFARSDGSFDVSVWISSWATQCDLFHCDDDGPNEMASYGPRRVYRGGERWSAYYRRNISFYDANVGFLAYSR